MTLKHEDGKPFRPTRRGGGSRPGKPQAYWPWVFKVVADALYVRAAGTREALRLRKSWFKHKTPDGRWVSDRDAFQALMDGLCPGWREWCDQNLGDRKTDRTTLLKNRAYKAACYSGTSDRGPGAVPLPEKSGEHWHRYFSEPHPFFELFENILAGRVSVIDWEAYLDQKGQRK